MLKQRIVLKQRKKYIVYFVIVLLFKSELNEIETNIQVLAWKEK